MSEQQPVRRKSKVRKEEVVRRIFERTLLLAARRVEGTQIDPSAPGYNSDGDASWKDLPSRTRIAVDLVKGFQAAQRSKEEAGPRQVLSVVIMPQRIESAQAWEQFALTAESPRKVIDVEAVSTKDPVE